MISKAAKTAQPLQAAAPAKEVLAPSPNHLSGLGNWSTPLEVHWTNDPTRTSCRRASRTSIAAKDCWH